MPPVLHGLALDRTVSKMSKRNGDDLRLESPCLLPSDLSFLPAEV